MTKHFIASIAALAVLAGPAAAATPAKAPAAKSQAKHQDKAKSNVKDAQTKAPKSK
ncbi:MAG TPA: hypothetical protein VGE68_00405 [Sphingomicrobium sp.]